MPKIAQGIYLRGKTYWYAVQENKQRRFISLKTDNEQEALRRAALAKAHASVPSRKDSKGETLTSQIARYVASKEETEKHVLGTTKWANRALGQFSTHIKDKSVRSVTPEDISGFYAALRKRVKPNGKKFSENAAHSYLRAVRGFMSWSVTAKLRFDNPAKEVRLGKPSQAARDKFATREERALLMECAIDDSTRFILFCTFWAGMRFNEVVEARPDWFNLEKGFINIQKTDSFTPKNKKNRVVPLSSSFKAFLINYGLKTPYMLEPIVKMGKGPYRYDFRAPWFKVRGDAAKKLNAELVKEGKQPTANFDWITPHVARHTFASLLAQQGTSIYKVAQWIGDTLEVTTKHYAHLAPSDNAINAID